MEVITLTLFDSMKPVPVLMSWYGFFFARDKFALSEFRTVLIVACKIPLGFFLI